MWLKKLASVLAIMFCFVIIQTIRVGMDLRMVEIFADDKGQLHRVYSTEPVAGEAPRLLGEEIFYKGEKIFDNYRENDGQRD